MARIALAFPILLIGTVFYLFPGLTRRGILFGVPVSEEFNKGPVASRARREFQWLIAFSAIAGFTAVSLAPQAQAVTLLLPVILVLLAMALLEFVRLHRRLHRFAMPASALGTALVSTQPERLPPWIWLAGLPLLFLAAAYFLHTHWQQIPVRFPVHWNIGAEPDRWRERTARGVYGPLLFGLLLYAWMLLIALGGWYGARRSTLRRTVLATAIAAGLFLAGLFAAIAVHPLLAVPAWVLPIATVSLIGGILFAFSRLSTQISEHTRKPAGERVSSTSIPTMRRCLSKSASASVTPSTSRIRGPGCC